MRTQQIKKQIADGIAIERNTHILRNTLQQVASQRGASLTIEQADSVIPYLQSYIEYVPKLLEELNQESKKAGIESSVTPLIQQVENYFFLEEDVMPDRLGLLGLMDDAYIANSVIHQLSSQYKLKTNGTLISDQVAAFNPVMRNLIGEPHATILDGYIQNILYTQPVKSMFEQLLTAVLKAPSFSVDRYNNHPIWGNATTDQVVNARMAQLGFV